MYPKGKGTKNLSKQASEQAFQTEAYLQNIIEYAPTGIVTHK
jgi:hypothetical protein